MSLDRNLVEVTAKHQIACKKCHAPAIVTFPDRAVVLVCPECQTSLGEWSTINEGSKDMSAFVQRRE